MDSNNNTSQSAECFGAPLEDLDQSLWDMFEKAAKQHPNLDAVVSAWQSDVVPSSKGKGQHKSTEAQIKSPEATRWSYSYLVETTEIVAAWLLERGCSKGKNLVAVVWNSAEWALFFWVAAKLRMPYIPLYPNAFEANSEYYIRLAKPHVLVVGDAVPLTPAMQSWQELPVRIHCAKDVAPGFTSLHEILAAPRTASHTLETETASPPGDDLALIIFTSGTTGVPKGCPHTAKNLWTQSFDFDPNVSGIYTDRWLAHLPLSHIMSINQTLRAWRYGGAVLIPSKSFDVAASLKVAVDEKATRMSAVPTLVQAMLAHPAFPGKEAMSLNYTTIGGTIVRERDNQMCKELGAETAFTGYGMSEGAPITTWSRGDPILTNGYHPGVGKVLPGFKIRVCEPASRRVLRRNEIGELHVGGPGIIEGYLEGRDSHQFYDDEAGSWLITGDQTYIDENDVLHICGRWKDVIIRGGENIAPAVIESCLTQVPGMFAAVVGIPDEIAGEVPVAVVRSLGTSTKEHLYRLVVKELGSSYALGSILTLEELNLESFPLTSVGKVKKEALKELVLESMQQSATIKSTTNATIPEKDDSDYVESNSDNGTPSTSVDLERESHLTPLVDQLSHIWEDIGAIALDANESMIEVADSITMLRYCNRVWKKLGKKIYLQNLIEHPSIAQQAKFLHQQESGEHSTSSTAENSLGVETMVFANGDPIRHNQILHEIGETLKRFGLSWTNDAEDVIPMRSSYHFLAATPNKPSTYQNRMLYEAPHHDAKALRRALHKALSTRAMFRTFLTKLPDGSFCHVVAKPSDQLFDILITEHTVSDDDSVRMVFQDDSKDTFDLVQMFHAVIFTVKNSASCYLMVSCNHSVFDALSMVQWNMDLDRLVSDIDSESIPQTPYKMFADLLYAYESSGPANNDVNFYVRRLRGISKFTKSFWPAQRAPSWVDGRDRSLPKRVKRHAVSELLQKPDRYQMAYQLLTCPEMEVMKTKRSIPPVMVVKTAIAILNTIITHQEYAIFTHIDSGRQWPFLLPFMKKSFPPAMSIDGPTIEWSLNMIRITADETVADLLLRIKDDQEDQERHIHAPWAKVLEKLGEEGRDALDATSRQCFNWDVSLGYLFGRNHDSVSLNIVARRDWPDCGFFWSANMLQNDELCVAATFDDMQTTLEEAESHVKHLLDIVSKLTTETNWDKTIGEILDFR